jgi:endonuclease-3
MKGPTHPSAGRPRDRAEEARLAQLLDRLAAAYPEAKCSLHFTNPWELLVATILSAQCTDERVNQVTPALFARYPDPPSLAQAPLEELEAAIKPTGYYQNKAKSLQMCARQLVERFGGEVPGTLEELTSLPGVGRKTAQVVLGNAFGVPGIAVDTHVRRLSQRMGLTQQTDPFKIEQELMQKVPPADWTLFSHRMIAHGRAVCTARRPRCGECPVADLCPQIGVAG